MEEINQDQSMDSVEEADKTEEVKQPENNESDKFKTVRLWGRFDVKFPFEPYQIQKDYMARVLQAAVKQKNALLESPTGTGKTLSLLWAALAWQESETGNISSFRESDSNLRAFEDLQNDVRKTLGIASCSSKIIYCSRTHSQLAQVMDELKSTPYRPKTVIIASRDHLCINEEVKKNKGVSLSMACKAAVRGNGDNRCHFKDSVEKFLEGENKFGDHKIQDIEELYKEGENNRVCPYFLQKDRIKSAELILMPYNYLIDEKIRENFMDD